MSDAYKKITYRCTACKWEKSLPASWGDVKPSFCGNTDKCEYARRTKGKVKNSFRKSPEKLEIIAPQSKDSSKKIVKNPSRKPKRK